jgi:hypothetical protein
LETWDINEDGPVESTGNNGATKQPSMSDPPVNGDDGYNEDVPTNPLDNNVTAANASAKDHSNDGSVQETTDVDGYIPVYTS